MINKLRANPLLSGSAVYLVSNILNAAIPFALLPILTRYLSPEEYGEVAMFQTLLGALGAFVGLSVAAAAARKYYDGNLGESELKHFIAACLQVLVASGALAFILTLTFSEQVGAWLGLETRWTLWAVFVAAASVVIQLRLGQWQVRKAARLYGAMQISQSTLNMLLSLLLVVIMLWGAGGRIVGQIVSFGFIALLSLTLLQRDHLLSFFVWRPECIKEVLAFGIPLIPHIAGAFILNAVDRFLVKQEIGLASAGIYMVAVQLTSAMCLVFDAVNRAYTPFLYETLKLDSHSKKVELIRYTYMWFILMLIGAGTFFAIGPFLVDWIAGEQYAQAGEIIGWLALGQAFMGMYIMMTGYILYSKRTGLLSLATITSALIHVILLIVLIRLFGLKGAAIAFSISMGLRFLLTWWVAQKRHPMPWFNLKIQD